MLVAGQLFDARRDASGRMLDAPVCPPPVAGGGGGVPRALTASQSASAGAMGAGAGVMLRRARPSSGSNDGHASQHRF